MASSSDPRHARAGKHPDAPSGGRGVFGAGSPNIAAVDAAITRLHEIERRSRALEAERQLAYAEARQAAEAEAVCVQSEGQLEGTIAYRSVKAMLAASLRLSEQTIGRHLERAHEVVSAYQQSHEALATGEISDTHVSVILDAGQIIGQGSDPQTPEVAERRAKYEALVVDHAKQVSPTLLRSYARKIAEQLATVSLDERHEHAKRFRKVSVQPLSDGMSLLFAELPSDEAAIVFSRLTKMAKLAAAVEERELPREERRRIDEIRADLLSDFLKNGKGDNAIGTDAAVTGVVQVVVHAEHLVGDAAAAEAEVDVPVPEIEGHGPIPVRAARNIAGRATKWVEVVVDVTTETVCDVESRTPSAEQKRLLLVRDQHCRWPGCRMPGYRCEIDHTIAVEEGGPTTMQNLGFLCVGHHTLKRHGGWAVTQHPNADYEWTTPTGEVMLTEAPSTVRFKRTDDVPRRTASPPGRSALERLRRALPPPRPEEYQGDVQPF